MPDWIPYQRSIAVSLVALPIALSIGYLYRLNVTIQETTSAPQTGRYDADAPATTSLAPRSLPEDVKEDLSRWVVRYERVSSKPIPISALTHPIATATLPKPSPTELLLAYLRATHVAFSWTPQAPIMRAVIKESNLKQTFDKSYIDQLPFHPHDAVNGLYRVSHHEADAQLGAERVELMIDPPPSFGTPPVRGLLVAAMEPSSSRDEEEVVFVNETWMWRTVDEPPTLLESTGGKWFHSKLAAWLVVKGLKGITKRESSG